MGKAGFCEGLAEYYDEIEDLWYSWLFSRLHLIIVKEVINKFRPKSVLDIGCGTGFQSFLHAFAGAEVVGIDISEDIVRIAKQKAESFSPKQDISLFQSHFRFVNTYNNHINDELRKRPADWKYIKPRFYVADAIKIPFSEKKFDHINCCGSTLSFVKKHEKALSEIKRLLKPNGTLLIELESRWNFDLFWDLLDAIMKHRIGYSMSFKEAIRNIVKNPQNHVYYNYPLCQGGKIYKLELKAFSYKRLAKELSNFKLKILKKWTIHSITTIIPSKILDKPKPSRILRKLFNFLRKIEEKIPFNFPGSSLIILARKDL